MTCERGFIMRMVDVIAIEAVSRNGRVTAIRGQKNKHAQTWGIFSPESHVLSY